MIDKRAFVEAICTAILGDIAVLERAARDAREAATHEEMKPENSKDTRSVEAAYLAGAQADRVQALESDLAVLRNLDLRERGPDEPATAGCLVQVDQDSNKSWYFLAHAAGGRTALGVTLLTPKSPIGSAVVEHGVGEVVEVLIRGKLVELEIVAVV